MVVPKTFSIENAGETFVVRPLDCVGNLAGPALKAELDGLLEELRHRGSTRVVIDLQRLPYFGTNLLEAMHMIWRPVRAKGGKMALCNVSDVGQEILRVSRFDTLWPVLPTQEEALATLAK
jgi:anti-anti-sigma factor